MKVLKYILVALFLAATATNVSAKSIKKDHLYIFGFSASFKDSTVYITNIQDVPGAWVDTKTKFLLGRDNYSYQLREYLSDKQQQPNRVCLVIYALTQKKAEKLYQKMKKKYVERGKGTYSVQYLTTTDFKFEAVDMSPETE